MASEADICVVKMTFRARNPPPVCQNLVLQGHGVGVAHGLERPIPNLEADAQLVST